MKHVAYLLIGLLVINWWSQPSPTQAAINAPRGLVVDGSTDPYSLRVSWVNPDSSTLDHINIYFANFTSGDNSTIAGPPLGDYGLAGVANRDQAQPNTNGQFTITNLADQRGTTNYYYIYLRAVDSMGVESAATPSLRRQTGISQDLTATEPVSRLTATATSSTSLRLTWTNPTADDLYQIKTYRSTTAPVIKSEVNLIATQTVLPNTAGAFNDTGLIANTQYYYLVHTVDVVGNYSEPANTSGTTLSAPVTPPVTPPVVTPPSNDNTPPAVMPNPRNFDFRAQWIGQNGDLSADKTAHVVYAHAGDTIQFSLTLKNIGSSTWFRDTSDNANEIKIGTWRPQDRTSIFQAGDWLSANRTARITANVVSGGTTTITWNMVVPTNTAPATYREYFRPVAEYCKWFGPTGIFWDVAVE